MVANGFATELAQVSRKWQARLDERLKPVGLTVARWQALSQIARERKAADPAGACRAAQDRRADAGAHPRQPGRPGADRAPAALRRSPGEGAGTYRRQAARSSPRRNASSMGCGTKCSPASGPRNWRSPPTCCAGSATISNGRRAPPRRWCGRRARAPWARRRGRSWPARCGRPARGRRRRRPSGSCRAR